MRRITRRGFVGGMLGVLALAAAPVRAVARVRIGASASPSEKVARFFTNDAGAVRIGSVYLQAHPDEGDAETLFDALTPPGERPQQWWTSVSMGELRRTIRAAAHADFKSGDVVDLEGWQLARTEARLAALLKATGGG